MRITKIDPSSGGSELILTCIDGNTYTVTLSDAVRAGFGKYAACPGLLPAEVDDDAVTFLSKKLECLRYATYLLGISDKSAKALDGKLRMKGYPEDVRGAAIDTLKKNGLLNDAALCARWVRALADEKYFGPYRIKTELYAKGFDKQLIENALDDADIDFDMNALALAEKLTARVKPRDRKELDAFKRKLTRFGYGYDAVNAAVSQLMPEDETYSV